MKKLLLFTLSLFLLAGFCKAQNLVPNPSFEDTLECPDFPGQVWRAEGWYIAENTPDYFHSCCNNTFPVCGVPEAALHINTNSGYLPNSPTFDPGEVFRTDAPNQPTFWKMYRGGTEYGRIYNNNDNHFYIQASGGSGDLRFNASGANTYMTIAGSGNVGIGTTTPAHTLQVNGTIAAKQILIEEKDLLVLISDLQNEITELKKLLAAR